MEEREKKGPTLGTIQQGGQGGRSPNVLSYEQLGSCAYFIEAVTVLMFKRVNISPDLPT